MKETSALIEHLASRPLRVSGNALLAFALPLGAAALASLAALLIVLGAPFAQGIAPALGKLAFSLLLAAGAIAALFALAHPGRHSSLLLALSLAPIPGLAGLAMLEATGGVRGFAGSTWQQCVIAVSLSGALGFAAAIYALRHFAPVRLRRAGFAAGLTGGGIAASAYAPFCPEPGALFVLVFFAGPIIVLAGLGWLTGPRLLRW